ncbi:MAG: AAA family ATPase [Deltaproteobacteria bacterium]|jgi:class 3 adenylate cyclase/tetratricopeptide (TPR) repeat protein|nr:AAA family ATPase [Deltaproteobacteria bacterium]
MECPNCQVVNRKAAFFCLECGTELVIICPDCKKSLPPKAKFCDACGLDLRRQQKDAPKVTELSLQKETLSAKPIASERKHVTALFSDLSGYTAMSERLDPEEVKEITARIFDEVSKIIGKYEGFVEKFAGDAVMALFGATEAHEDDPVRAIKAAREIHNRVNALSPQYEERIEQPLVMHSGINTGLVVTGDIDLEKGTHGVAGDTINIAARLSDLGMADEILVGPDTFYQSEGYFDFKELAPATVKGKSKPVRIYKVIGQKEQPIKLHRLHGLKADLIGRKAEMTLLSDAVQKLKDGSGAIVSIYGTAGTGKSRLIQEFKASLNLEEIQWMEGNAFPHSQNIPYAPLINLLSRSLLIREGDPPEEIREKVEEGLKSLIGKNQDLVPYVGSLFSLSYPEIEDVSPEHWKAQLQKAIRTILAALAKRAPTIVCLEDLHWTDPSFLELIRLLISEFRDPVFFVCAYRPVISLFTGHQLSSMSLPYREIRLQDLSISESQGMVESLLKTDTIPSELQRFLQDKVEGNPFYIEEVINSLIESDTLIRDNSSWKLTREITEAEVSSTIHGVIAGRLDRLEKESKRILQEASVIGRSFFYEILSRVTDLKQQVDRSLRSLERLDLIRARALQPDLEYIFKHALTQEVVYNGLLKKERKLIHERIGLVMEQLFRDRLPEFYETLAYHFQQGKSALKAVEYLMKSAVKSLKRYSLDEAHKYFQEAYDILGSRPEKTLEDKRLIVDLILEWALVFYYRCDGIGWKNMFESHKELAESIDDPERLAMFYAWHGFVFLSEDNEKAMNFLQKALDIGERLENQKLIGYACTWLTWICSDLSRYDEAFEYGARAQEISRLVESDHYLYFKSLGAIATCYWEMGATKKLNAVAKDLLDYGNSHSNIRCQTMGHMAMGGVDNLVGDIAGFIENFQKAIVVSADIMYDVSAKTWLGMGYALNNQIQEAETLLKEVVAFCEKNEFDWAGMPARLFLGTTLVAKGNMRQGFKMIDEAHRSFFREQRRYHVALTDYILGKIYSQIVEGSGPVSPLTVAKNIGFLVKNIPFADKKADTHFSKAIELAEAIGAKSITGPAYLDWGRLHKAKKGNAEARECLTKATQIFAECEADRYLQQAREALASVN